MYSHWTIGRRTPALIVSLYVLALALATGHFAFFRYLDGRALRDSLSQQWVSTISTAFVVSFSSALGGSLATAFTQRLWRVYRERPMKLSTIGVLYTALHSPISLTSLSFLANAKLEWLFALTCWCVPVLVTFPSGGIRVVAEGRNSTVAVDVPTFNPEYRWPKQVGRLSNQTAVRNQALFKLAADGDYIMPLAEITSPINVSLLRGQYLTIPSPCGQNCSYSISFPGPTFKCRDTGLKRPYQFPGYEFLNATNTDFIGTENLKPIDGSVLKTYSSSVVGFEIGYSFKPVQSGAQQNAPGYEGMKSINCSSWLSTYNLDISFRNGVQETIVRLEDRYILNATSLTRRWQFGPDWRNESLFSSDVSGEPPGHAILFMEMQAFAIRDSVVNPLLGSVLDFNSEIPKINRTMILETPWAPNPKIYTWDQSSMTNDPLALSITPRTVEDMLINATLSTLTMGNWTTTVNDVTRESWTNYYRFSRVHAVLLPYGIALAVSLAMVGFGLAALIKNGVAAEDGFLQAACTTAGGGNATLEQMLASGCLGGPENTASVDGESDIKFLYGELLATQGGRDDQGDAQGEGLVRRAGFGPVDEVGKLKKGATYGIYHKYD